MTILMCLSSLVTILLCLKSRELRDGTVDWSDFNYHGVSNVALLIQCALWFWASLVVTDGSEALGAVLYLLALACGNITLTRFYLGKKPFALEFAIECFVLDPMFLVLTLGVIGASFFTSDPPDRDLRQSQ